ncbi:MAG: hypothetical protein QT11_C0001G0481 [archaeon GW2011_AR20]|nr:MAG: hypothetical protein QT11_C0001G0481 [archaeon GW2011_AR20]AQS28152.1 hypothetical protein [uncultured archaeon]AQS28752.1 hypothetical protein [uncultured archaeon]MBS3160551.1 hypothetical protein [Candidatus Woesearchaeota archaeon]
MVLLKKAQVETVGLVIIVIIITFALIFGLQFMTRDKGNELNERYLQLNADNMRSVIMKTTINNCNIKDEIINYETFDDVACFDNEEELKLTIRQIIESSLKNDYGFSAGKIDLKKGSCENKDTITSSIQPLALTNIKVSLRLC